MNSLKALLIFLIVCLLLGQIKTSAHVCMANVSEMSMHDKVAVDVKPKNTAPHRHHFTVEGDATTSEEPTENCCQTACQCTQSSCSVTILALLQKQSISFLYQSEYVFNVQTGHFSLVLNSTYKPPIYSYLG